MMKSMLIIGICLFFARVAICEPTSNRLALATQVAVVESAALADEIVAELSAEMPLSTNAQSALRELARAVVPAIQKEVVLVLAESFTAEELRVLIRFNELEPVLSNRCMRALEKYLKENPQLTKNLATRIKEESEAQPDGCTVPTGARGRTPAVP